MSNKTKKIGMWSLKALAIGLFVFLAVVNVQMVTGADVSVSDISATMPSATAEGGGYNCEASKACSANPSDYVKCKGVRYCKRLINGVECDEKVTTC